MKVLVTKISDNPGQIDAYLPFEGNLLFIPEVGLGIVCLNGENFIKTSVVNDIEDTDDGFILTTNNSKYEVKILDIK